MRRIARRVCWTAAVWVLAAPAQATTMLARTTEQLFHDADVVAVAQVKEIHTTRSDKQITTHVTLVLSEGFKGTAGGTTVEVLVPGGNYGKWGERVEGAAALTAGEDCVVFLTRIGERFRFTGMEQGKLRIESDAAHPGTYVVRRTMTARMLQRAPDGTMQEVPPQPMTEPVEPFLAKLRQLAEAR